MSDHTIIALGRYGDLVNILPLAYNLSRTGKVNWLVSQEFASFLDGVSYVTPHIWPHAYHNTLSAAIAHAKAQRMPGVIVAQPCGHPDKRRLTDSYQREAWRHAGRLDEFGRWPTVFDRRNVEREEALIVEWIPRTDRPVVLVATGGVSSPFASKFKLLAMIRGIDCEVVDLSIVQAERPYDLLGLMREADCLVTVDSLPLHLARATNCPVVAIVNMDWKGSVPPPQALSTFRYDEAEKDLMSIVAAVSAIVARAPGKVIHVADIHGHSERHLRARKHWKPGVDCSNWSRDARSIGDKRALPFMRDLLTFGLEEANASDCILWTNDDVSFAPEAFDEFARHVARFDFGCTRRDAAHIGREAFFFRAGWLRAHLHEMPDVILAVQKFDLILARWLRSFRGIPTTRDNLIHDMQPVEIHPGLVVHESHESSWTSNIDGAASQHNEKIWNQ